MHFMRCDVARESTASMLYLDRYPPTTGQTLNAVSNYHYLYVCKHPTSSNEPDEDINHNLINPTNNGRWQALTWYSLQQEWPTPVKTPDPDPDHGRKYSGRGEAFWGGHPLSKTAGHARAKSTATGLTAATTLKPPSSRVSTAASVASSTKPTTRSQTLQARGAGHRVSASTSSAAIAAAPPSVTGPNRPAFNNNQQHYSPLKSHAPKPLTSTFLAPPSPSKLPSNVAISAETARLQTELLQLSLLHRDAGATAADWHESAQQKLGSRFEELVRAEHALGGRERDGVEARNAAVLVRWGAAQASTEVVGGLEEKVQMLDQVVNGVWRFGEPGGRYARVIEEFEAWAGRLQGIMEARRIGDVNSLLGDGADKGEVLFVGDLENRWRDECPGLVRKLEEWRRILRHLGPVPDGDGNGDSGTTTEESGGSGGQKSSLAKILEGCTSMVDDMLAELGLMEQMVREAIRAEDDWIEAMNKELNLGNEKDTQSERSAPLWKMVV
ncbi:AGA1 A-agglutinin anchor subunit [Apiospora arundinis]